MKKAIIKSYFIFKKFLYSFFSNNRNIRGNFKAYQPVVLRGEGSISFGENVIFGVLNSPMLYSSYAYIEARAVDSKIVFGNNISVNNGFSIASEKNITIKDDVLIGLNCRIMDSNFHSLDPLKRKQTDESPQEIVIGKNVFIGNNVTILKGVTIGDNSVIGVGSVVTKSFPENSVIAGNPAKQLKTLN